MINFDYKKVLDILLLDRTHCRIYLVCPYNHSILATSEGPWSCCHAHMHNSFMASNEKKMLSIYKTIHQRI